MGRITAIAATGMTALAVLMVAPPAVAEPLDPDSEFLTSLDANGIQDTNRDAVITAGKAVCDFFDQGYSIDAVTLAAARAGSLLKSIDEADDFVGAATVAYCPRYVGT